MPVDAPVLARFPAHLAHALRRIAAELRHLPRECVADRLELVCWLSRQARQLDEVAGSRMLQPAEPARAVVVMNTPTPCATCKARRCRSRRRKAPVAGQLSLPLDQPGVD